ncbi:MAG: SurA N-terminal domain-containing protein [Desulfococcaceae bacterium]
MLTTEKIKRFSPLHQKIGLLPSLVVLFWVGCDFPSKPAAEAPPPAVQVGETRLSRTDFQQAFEIHKTAYVHEDITRPEVLDYARRDFLKQMVERLTLLERARELELSIPDAELDRAATAATAGYPEGAFERVLLESAIPFDTWKSELRTRLLMERTVEADLAARVSVSAAELEAYLKTPEAPQDPGEAERRLRRRKVEAEYAPWLNRLQERYSVKINLPDADPAIGQTPRESSP